MRILAPVVLVLGSLALAGCGGGDDKPPVKGEMVVDTGDDKKQLATLLTEFVDTGSAASMSVYFSGTKVSAADYKRYAAFQYEFDGEPEVSGGTATGKVKMKTQEKKEAGTKDWTFAKEKEKWKLKSAPLP